MAFKIKNIFAAGTKAKADEVNENFSDIEKEINESLLPGLFEPGDLKYTARANAPEGWLICNGAAVSRVTYSDLFAAIGTTYGAGDGATTFNLPDARGRTLIGPDSGAGRVSANNSLGKSGGSEKLAKHFHEAGSLVTGGQSQPHFHNLGWFASTRHEGSGFAYDGVSVGGNTPTTHNVQDHTHDVSGNTADAGEGNSGNLQPYLVGNLIVKV